MPSIYLINPRNELPSYFSADVFEHRGFDPATGIADLAIATVAGLVPRHWDIALCDEHISAVDLNHSAEFIGITGKITQGPRMRELAAEFRRRGKIVIIGGPYASLSPDEMRGHCDVLVRGELEPIAAQFFGDLESGAWQTEYQGNQADLATHVMPRWDLYPNHRALMGCVQTSRGCPFNCEFCDVIPYLGRNQRLKPVAHVLAELDVLYELGHRNIFLADDNFTASRRYVRDLLAHIKAWNQSRTEGYVFFSTQLSIDAARDPQLVRLCSEAGLNLVYIGIETPNESSLRESGKRQNVGCDVAQRVRVFADHGISVFGGMIVGFDHDSKDIFQTQYRFAMSAGVPVFSLGALVAPAATPLYQRLQASGRLRSQGAQTAATPMDTNIVPLQMTREELLDGLRALCNRLYAPASFTARVLQMIAQLQPHPLWSPTANRGVLRRVEVDTGLLVRKLRELGAEERQMLRVVLAAVSERPWTAQSVMSALYRYAQIRSLYEIGNLWDPAAAAALADADAEHAMHFAQVANGG